MAEEKRWKMILEYKLLGKTFTSSFFSKLVQDPYQDLFLLR